MRFLYLLLIPFLLQACNGTNSGAAAADDPSAAQAQEIVDQAIAAHGGERYHSARIAFDFRGRHYTSERDRGLYTYQRIFTDTSTVSPVQVRDVLDNNGFSRYVMDKEFSVDAEMAQKYSNSVNSVLYFIQLPYLLNDGAVFKKYLGEATIKDQPYHKVQVTFQQEGGGVDYQDVFIYWFHREKQTMDYLAYSYITEGGGIRFREAYNIRTVGGIRFADYVNYKADHKVYQVHEMDELFNHGKLKELSRIENTDIQVTVEAI